MTVYDSFKEFLASLPKKNIQCRNFKRYKGVFPPKCGCLSCEIVYALVQKK